jgi:hypothetical protein
MPKEHCFDLLSNLLISKSQIKQDLFVLSQTNFKRKVFFVDFGASNGIDLSNSYLLEKIMIGKEFLQNHVGYGTKVFLKTEKLQLKQNAFGRNQIKNYSLIKLITQNYRQLMTSALRIHMPNIAKED